MYTCMYVCVCVSCVFMCIYVCVYLCACLYYICIIRRVGTTFGIGGKGTEGALALATTKKLNWGKKQKDHKWTPQSLI